MYEISLIFTNREHTYFFSTIKKGALLFLAFSNL